MNPQFWKFGRRHKIYLNQIKLLFTTVAVNTNGVGIFNLTSMFLFLSIRIYKSFEVWQFAIIINIVYLLLLYL